MSNLVTLFLDAVLEFKFDSVHIAGFIPTNLSAIFIYAINPHVCPKSLVSDLVRQ